MTALAVVLMAALDVWSVSPSVTKAAEAGIPAWQKEASRSLSDEERRDVHLGDGFPAFNISDSDVPAFLNDLNPRRNVHNWQVIYSVLDRENQAIGWISVMVFDDSRGPKAGGFSWGRGGRLMFVSQVNETKKMPDVDRVLGVVNPDICSPDLWVVYLDKSGTVTRKAFSSAFDCARTKDTIVIGTVSDVRERALTIADSADSVSVESRYFDVGTLAIERVLKGSAWMGKMRIFFPSHSRSGELGGAACPPNIQSGDRRIWYLESGNMALTTRLFLPESRCVVPLEYLSQVEKEIAEDASRPSVK